jgi:large subunit ribosomal protein L4
MQSVVYNQTGKEVGEVKLPENVFGVKWNDALIHQVVVSMTGNERNPIAHAKTRGEVSGSGKKPWKQKGTGRARHGSRRSPIWVGGGVSHGPRKERDYSRKINKKMKMKALFAILSKKTNDGEIMFVDSIFMKEPKTKEAKNIIGSLSKVKGFEGLNRKRNGVFITLHGRQQAVEKSFRNFGNLAVGETRNLNPLDVLKYKYLIVENPEKSIEILSAKNKK